MATKSRKSSSNTNAKKSKENILPKRERSSGINKRRSVLINEDDFAYQFRKHCLENNTKINPNVRAVVREPSLGDFAMVMSMLDSNKSVVTVDEKETQTIIEQTIDKTELFPEVLVTYNDIYLKSVIFKQFQVCCNMLNALKKTLKANHNYTITVLKLEFCNLGHKEIQVVYTILKRNESIEELSVNGNPNKYQNHYLLLKDNKIKMLSMRFCKINEKGIKNLAGNINNESELIYLNLSSNYISDEGVVHLADSLRCNRSILSLNLADNWITDKGCMTILSVLQKFALYHDEIVLRRHRRMSYLLNKKELSKLLMQQTSSIICSPSQNIRSKISLIGNSKKRSSRAMSDTKSTISLTRKDQSISDTRNQLPQDIHPFVLDSYEENKEIYCKGNLTLRQLNLAYNKITTVGLRALAECLQYQRNMVKNITEGLTRVQLEGNTAASCSPEMNEIYELIAQRFDRRKSTDSTRSRRRSSSGLSVKLSLPI